MSDDDYWNESYVKKTALDFQTDEVSSTQFSKLGAEVRANLNNSSSVTQTAQADINQQYLPLHLLISDTALEKIIRAQSGEMKKDDSQNAPHPSVPITIKRLILGRPCSLSHHKSLKSKTQLLDAAISIGDGNCILIVVLFLVQTLKKKLVYQLLSDRPIAVDHYVNYLMTRMKIHELSDLLIMLGRGNDAAMKHYQSLMSNSGSSIEVLLNKLKNIASNHFNQPSVDSYKTGIVQDYIKLLEWQKTTNSPEINNKSVLQCLAFCCLHHTDVTKKLITPHFFSQQNKVNSQQYDWTILTIQANTKNWNLIETMFIKKNMLGRSTISCSISLPKIIDRLHELGANSVLLSTYLGYISSVDQRMELAKKYKVHRAVIDCFVNQKDRQGLTQYKMTLHPQSEEYFIAENAIRTNTVQWKN